MVHWLVVTILAYLFFGLASFFDKLVLAGKPKPNSYTFYVGVFSLFVVLIIPFTGFDFPDTTSVLWVALDAIVHIFGLYTMFVAIEKFDVSRVVATIGATQPIFIFILTCLFWGESNLEAVPHIDILAFFMLFLGSIIISIEKTPKITGEYLKITIVSSIMFALDYVFSKFVFLNQPFIQGIIWIRIFVFLFVLFFLINKKSRQEIFSKKIVLDRGIQATFWVAQTCGGAANFLQSFAIYLAPVAFLATINSLRGIQYIFLFIITLFVSAFLPKFLKEELSRGVIIQKAISILLIASGLAILIY